MIRHVTLLIAILSPLALRAQADSGAFLMQLGRDTLVVERFAHAGDTVSGSIDIRGQPRLEYRAIRGADGLVPTIAFRVFALNAAADAAPIREVKVTMRGDSAFVDLAGAHRGYPTTVGALPLLNNSFALTELYTSRARQHGDSADIPVWLLSGGVNLVVAVRAVGPDSMTVSVAGQESRLRVDRAGKILGGAIPSQRIVLQRLSMADARGLRLNKADYGAPPGAPYTATEVTFRGPGSVMLGGTLTMPKGERGAAPAVVTITGSGQQDRDEFIPVAGGYRLFRQVADTLSRRGIAVLRLDDRMVGLSSGPLGTSADYADDIRAALTWLRARPGIDPNRIGLVGHSEGGMIAPMVAASDSLLRGIVLLAGTAETGETILRYQQKEAIDNDTSIAIASRDSLYRVAALATDSAAKVNPWLSFFLHHDPIPVAKRVSGTPVLILQGANDHQVTPEQAKALEAAFLSAGNKDVTVRLFAGLNHLFLPDPSGLPSGYARLTNNQVSPEVLGALADWLSGHL